MKLTHWKHVVVATLMAVVPSLGLAIGAIAIDDEVGEEDPGYGWSTGYKNRADAERRAVKECRAHGNTNCRAVVWFESCGAYAASRKYYGYGWGKTLAIAEKAALKMCGRNNCEVKVSGCEE